MNRPVVEIEADLSAVRERLGVLHGELTAALALGHRSHREAWEALSSKQKDAIGYDLFASLENGWLQYLTANVSGPPAWSSLDPIKPWLRFKGVAA